MNPSKSYNFKILIYITYKSYNFKFLIYITLIKMNSNYI